MAGSFIEFQHVDAEYSSSEGLGAIFGKKEQPVLALKDISFSLEVGDHVVVFGPPASGKSTLLSLLAGMLAPKAGALIVNGKKPGSHPMASAGYVPAYSKKETNETVYGALLEFGNAHDIPNLPARIGEITQALGMQEIMNRSARMLSSSEHVLAALAKAALSDAPVLLLDDVADVLGAEKMKHALNTILFNRTVCIATRNTRVAEELELSILLLHKASLAHSGSREDIANEVGVAKIVDVWLEGLRYDMLRSLKSHPGVLEVRLMPTDQFDGSRLRIQLRNSRYLPSLYDLVSRGTLVSIEETPSSLTDILASL